MASLSDFATNESQSTFKFQNRSSNLLTTLNARDSWYKKQYGADPEAWKAAGKASLLAADLSEGFAKHANMEMQLNALKAQTDEVEFRGNKLLAMIGQQAKQVQGQQMGTFIKAGVKLEGSALNVLTDTVLKANEAEAMKKRELDYSLAQSKIQQTLIESKMDNVGLETALGMAGSLAYGSAR